MILFLFVILLVAYFLSLGIYRLLKYGDEGHGFIVLAIAILVLIILIPIWDSYERSKRLEIFYENIQYQYSDAMLLYDNHATLSMSKLTDMDEQSFNKEISTYIIKLRDEIVDYNTKLILKQKLKKSPVLSWYVILPTEDIKPISLIERD